MRILYIGQLWEGGTCLERMRILGRMGHEIIPFDVTPFMESGTRLARSLAHRTNSGLRLRRLNQRLVALSAEHQRHELVWVDKGTWIYPETLQVLRRNTRSATLVHYTADAQLIDNRSRHFVTCIPHYDILITTKRFEMETYHTLGAKEVLLVLQGYDSRFAPRAATSSERSELNSDVCFIGHYQPHYAGRLKAARRAGGKLRIWGPRWRRYAMLHPWARAYVESDSIWGDRYPTALACSKIALGLLSKRVPETTTTRTFEIPATGVFLLAERTDDHLALFKEGAEAEFFGNDEELSDKIRFYLKNDEARQRIAAAGHERCLRSRYSAESQIRKVLEHVGKLDF